MNVGKSKVMRCSRYGNGYKTHVILNGEQFIIMGGIELGER